MSYCRINVHLTKQEKIWLENLALKYNKSVSGIIKSILKKYSCIKNLKYPETKINNLSLEKRLKIMNFVEVDPWMKHPKCPICFEKMYCVYVRNSSNYHKKIAYYCKFCDRVHRQVFIGLKRVNLYHGFYTNKGTQNKEFEVDP